MPYFQIMINLISPDYLRYSRILMIIWKFHPIEFKELSLMYRFHYTIYLDLF
jgi:hypothetical protein